MKPSDICEIYPWDSIFQNCEKEQSICCMMRYLAENGNEFKPFSFEDYQKVQPNANETRFNELVKYCKSEDTARLVCNLWDINNKDIFYELEDLPLEYNYEDGPDKETV